MSICAIDVIGDSDFFTFEGTAGDSIVLQAIEIGNVALDPCIELFFGATSIDQICEANDPRINATLGQSGTYTIVVSEVNDDATGSYHLALERVSPIADSGNPICFGCLIGDTVDPEGDLDLYTFQGVAGDTILLQAIETGNVAVDPCIELFSAGVSVDSVCEANDPKIEITLDQTGEHTLIVSEVNNDATGPYSLTIERLSPLSCMATNICFGCTVGDGIESLGDLDLFAFSGTAGDFVMITIAKTSSVSMDPCVELFMDGSSVDSNCDANNAMISATLAQSGEYIFVVSEVNNDSTGDYNATLQCIGSCQGAVLSCPEAIFLDGFETGDTSLWSS